MFYLLCFTLFTQISDSAVKDCQQCKFGIFPEQLHNYIFIQVIDAFHTKARATLLLIYPVLSGL